MYGIGCGGSVSIINNTIVDIERNGITTGGHIAIKNNIIANAGSDGIYCGSTVDSSTISYNNMWNNNNNFYNGAGAHDNIFSDPCFADTNQYDYHLQSAAGRWEWSKYIGLDPTGDGFIDLSDFAALAGSWQKQGSFLPADLDNSGLVDLVDLRLLLDNYLANYSLGEWVFDDVTSPCIDAGDPASDWSEELSPNGSRINMGAYGGTPQASMSLSNAGNIANLDYDSADIVDFNDLAMFVNKWCQEEILIPEDLDRNGFINFAEFAGQWLWEE